MDSSQRLQELAHKGINDYTDAPASEILQWLVHECGTNFVIASNMQDGVLIDYIVKTLTPSLCASADLNVLFLDTGYHFAETLHTKASLQKTYGFNTIDVHPTLTIADQTAQYGPDLFLHNPHLCCSLRKIQPIAQALKGYSAWITGIRRVEASTRATDPVISFDKKFELIKVNPLANWSDEKFNNYIHEHNVYVNPLVEQGYLSIGCQPCTQKSSAQDPRSGRWAGFNKTECGLHH